MYSKLCACQLGKLALTAAVACAVALLLPFGIMTSPAVRALPNVTPIDCEFGAVPIRMSFSTFRSSQRRSHPRSLSIDLARQAGAACPAPPAATGSNQGCAFETTTVATAFRFNIAAGPERAR